MAIINSVIVSGGGSAPKYYIEKEMDANGKLVNGNNIIDLTGVTDVGDYALEYAYRANARISGTVDMSDIITISGASACNSAFQNTFITGIDLSSLTTISGNSACSSMLAGCQLVTTLSLPSLTTISGNYACSSMFSSNGITSMIFPSLTTITGQAACQQMFMLCRNLTSLSFPAITTTSFGSSYTNQFNQMCVQIPNITLHFPSNVQSVIEGLQGYSTTAPFSATSGTVLYDLPATE